MTRLTDSESLIYGFLISQVVWTTTLSLLTISQI